MPRSPLLSFAPLVLGLSLVTGAQAFELHRDLPEKQRRSFEYDLATLDRVELLQNEDTTEAARLMGVSGRLDANALRAWLEERAHYIVPETWEFGDGMTTKDSTRYPNPRSLPTEEVPTKKPDDGKVSTLMSNIGTALYLTGKKLGFEISVKFARKQMIEIRSPRTGIIQVGPGLYGPSMRAEPAVSDTPANAYARLATFFHESRHSDGNGTSLGFLHAICPASSTYEGYAACDRNQNGPYTVQAKVLKVLLQQCETCSVQAKEALRLRILDAASRALPGTPELDATSEGIQE